MANGQYAYGYLVDENGIVTGNINDIAPFEVINGAYVGQPDTLISNIGLIGNSFQGFSDDNSAYFSADSQFFYITNTPYSEGAQTPDPEERNLTPYVACFLAGTMVATALGDRPVETLKTGDQILTADGRSVPVKWIGHQTLASFFVTEERAPIVISAGALGEGLPARDLKLTADHALLLDGVLVQAGALVNGTTIRRMTKAETGDRYTVFHIETEGHEIILAEGCAAETFVDNVSRGRFDNYAEYEALFGGEAETILEMDLPRAMSARQLPDSIRALIEIRRAA